MRGRLFGFSLGLGSRRSLAARGHFLNTFAGFGYGLALSLLALGAYLIGEQFENPVEAQSVGLLFAALLIATSVTLLYAASFQEVPAPRRSLAGRRFLGTENNRACQMQHGNAGQGPKRPAVARPLRGPYARPHSALTRFTPEESPGSNAPRESAGDAARAQPQ